MPSSQDAASVHVLRTSLLFSDVLEREVFGDVEMHDLVRCGCEFLNSLWHGCVFIHGLNGVGVYSYMVCV